MNGESAGKPLRVPPAVHTLTIRQDPYELISRSVESCIAYGLQRYNKYREEAQQLSEEAIRDLTENLTTHVLDGLCELMDFPENLTE